jgi:hypothetical protein
LNGNIPLTLFSFLLRLEKEYTTIKTKEMEEQVEIKVSISSIFLSADDKLKSVTGYVNVLLSSAVSFAMKFIFSAVHLNYSQKTDIFKCRIRD